MSSGQRERIDITMYDNVTRFWLHRVTVVSHGKINVAKQIQVCSNPLDVNVVYSVEGHYISHAESKQTYSNTYMVTILSMIRVCRVSSWGEGIEGEASSPNSSAPLSLSYSIKIL